MSKSFTVQNTGQSFDLKDGESILDSLRRNKVNIRSSCGGHSTCSDCVIRVKSGGKGLSDVNFEERKLLGNVYFITKERLACQTRARDDIDGDIENVEIDIVNLD